MDYPDYIIFCIILYYVLPDPGSNFRAALSPSSPPLRHHSLNSGKRLGAAIELGEVDSLPPLSDSPSSNFRAALSPSSPPFPEFA